MDFILMKNKEGQEEEEEEEREEEEEAKGEEEEKIPNSPGRLFLAQTSRVRGFPAQI